MSHKDAPPETATQVACREFWQKAQPHVKRAWGRAKDGSFLAEESRLLHKAWVAAQDQADAADRSSPPSPEAPTMTADVELLPLPKWGGAQIVPDSLIENYARACVAHATAAKDAEIEELRAEVARRNGIDPWAVLLRAQEAEARAERLAEALDAVVTFAVRYQLSEGDQCVVDARALLNPTAAQENDDA